MDQDEFHKVAFPVQPGSLAERQKNDLELWKKWKDNGMKQDDLRPLLSSFRPFIRSQANRWVTTSSLEVHPAAIYNEFNNQFVNALETYDPNKGQLNTWVGHNLKKAGRWMAKVRPFARMGSDRFSKVGQFQNAKSVLFDQFDREPTAQEIAEHMGVTPNEVTRLEMETRKVMPASGWDYDPLTVSPSREAEALRLAMGDFTPEEQLVADYTWGLHGKQAMKPGQIAQQLGYSGSKISRLRNTMTEKVDKYLK